MNTHDKYELPPLPQGEYRLSPDSRAPTLYDEEAMEAYARAAIEADRQRWGEPANALSDAKIREVLLANGFTIKPGHDDLKQYVYDAARALLARYGQLTEPGNGCECNQGQSCQVCDPVEPEGWTLVPKVPTHEMIRALWETITDNHDTTDGGYRAMIEAAPKFGEEK